MTVLWLVPVVLSALLLAAHFSRAGNLLLVAVSLAFPLVLVIQRRWAARLVQAALLAGGIEWIRTVLVLVAQRRTEGGPWLRLAIILGTVALVTVCSALVFQLPSLRRKYSL